MRLRRKTFDLLCAFVQQPAYILSKDVLLDAVWGVAHLHPDSLSQAIGELRRALGDDAKAPRFIATLHGRGYRFICPVEARATAEPAPIAQQPALVGTGDALPTAAAQRSRHDRTSLRVAAGLALLVLASLALFAVRFQTVTDQAQTNNVSTNNAPASPTTEPLRLALPDLTFEGEGMPSWLVVGVPTLLGSRLARRHGVFVYPRTRMETMRNDLALAAHNATPGSWPAVSAEEAMAIHRYLDADIVIAGNVRRVADHHSTIALTVLEGATGNTLLRRSETLDHDDLAWLLQRLGEEIADRLQLAGGSARRRGPRALPTLASAAPYFQALRVLPQDPAQALKLLRTAEAGGKLARIAAARCEALLQLGDREGALQAAREARNLSQRHDEEVVYDLLAGHHHAALNRLRRAAPVAPEGAHRDAELWLRLLWSLVEAEDAATLFTVLDHLPPSTLGPWLEAELALIEATAAALTGDVQRQVAAARRAAVAAQKRGQQGVLTRALALERSATGS